MYYRLFDKQTGRYMSTGYNVTSKKELKNDILSYVSVDTDKEEMKKLGELKVEDIANIMDFEIENQKNKFDEEENN